MVQNTVFKAQFGYPIKKGKPNKRKSIYDLSPALLKEKQGKDAFELSEEDKIIYGV